MRVLLDHAAENGYGLAAFAVDTDNRLAITGAIREVFATRPEQFDPRKCLGPTRAAMQQVCQERMVAFGQAGRAGQVKPITCKEMVSFYRR
jgi:fructose-bisphosphate aldolase, class II